MANITETSTFEPVIHEIGVEEKVLGGPGGNSNVQAQQLANRTKWLKDAIDALESGGGPFEYNASSGNLPLGGTDGPGVGGIKRKDQYFVTVPGTVSAVTLQVGDVLIAKVDDADTIGEFIIQQGNSELATPTVIGMVKLVQNLSGGSQADAALSVAGLINLFAQLNSPALTGNPTTPDQTAGNNSTRIANTKYVDAAVGVEATNRNNAVNAEATARINGDNTEATNRSNADNTLQSNIDAANTARVNGDNTLQSNIDAANTARVNGDNTLQGNINAEATARANGDAAILNELRFNNVGWLTSGFTLGPNLEVYPTQPLRYKKVNGIVYITGMIRTTGTIGSGDLAFTLPVGYRPSAPAGYCKYIVGETILGGPIQCRIYNNGNAYFWEQGKTAGQALSPSYFHVDIEFPETA